MTEDADDPSPICAPMLLCGLLVFGMLILTRPRITAGSLCAGAMG